MGMTDKREDSLGVMRWLKGALTNHDDRKCGILNVSLISSKDNSLIARDEFKIYTNHPVDKIKEKVRKLKIEGGMFTLDLKELVEKTDGYYVLILSV